jgi:glyoxylase-like metal-dependent hydrolase (beta-lactamase superfamily II)
MKQVITVLLCALFCTGLVFAQQRALYQQTQYKGQEIGKLTGEIYYARMDDYVSVFMVTSEGIILAEPIGNEMAAWLKPELARRFNVPVKYVIYSHYHWDHASGGDAYAATAKTIGHENMLKGLKMPPADTPLPQNVRAQDVNKDGKIDKSEAQGQLKNMFELYDADKDGVLSGAEVVRGPLLYVHAPDITYKDSYNITLGGKRAELMWKPTGHADDNTIVRFVDGTNVLFASDWITVQRLPFGGDVATKDEIAAAKAVEGLNFEYFVCSHGKLGKKSDVIANIRYREELRDAVAKAIGAGQSLEQVRNTILMDNYKNWEFYDVQRPQNVAGTYRALMENR